MTYFASSASPCGEIRIIRSQASFLRRWTAYVLRTAAQRIDPICPFVPVPKLSEAEIAEIKARWLAMHDTSRPAETRGSTLVYGKRRETVI